MTTVDALLELYERWGSDHYDEELSQLDHALQTATLAETDGAPDETIVAALLHDVGHLLQLRGDAVGPHERTGPAHLDGLFPDAVLAPIALHVEAKRYLCAVEPEHAATLSAGSTASLRRQGGPMSAGEVVMFESSPGWQAAVALRRWDDAGKLPDLVVPGLAHHEPRLRALAR